MTHKTVPVSFNGIDYGLRFGAIGAYLLQEVTGNSIMDFATKVEDNTLGFLEMHALLYAELESGRRKDHSAPMPWTIDSVADLIDNECEGDLAEFWNRFHGPVIQAFQNSFALTIRKGAELEKRLVDAASENKRDDSGEGPLVQVPSTGESDSSGMTLPTPPLPTE